MSSSSKMTLFSLLLSLVFVRSSIAGYVLEDDYTPSNFFDMFAFWTEADPTNGFVDYVDRPTAQSSGLIGTTASTVYIGTDHENVTPDGRPSIRLTSNKAYNVGSLIIVDIEHMPGGICGTWPAFWMVGPDWPSGGEIDIIEGANEQTTNAMTLHTDSGCAITNNGNFSGSISTYDCDIYASGQTTNAGCSIDSYDTQSYGTGFNDIGGGVYATEWTNASISVWFFPRSSVPGDIASGSPDPSSWGTPTAQFQGGCDIPDFFHDNQLVFDLTYCGDWAGNVWSSSSCSSKADTCNDYVRDNPTEFTNAYWTINSLQAFQYSASSPVASTSSVQTSSSAGLSLSAGLTISVGVSSSTKTSASVSTTSKSANSASSSAYASSSTSSSTTLSSTAASSTSTSFSWRWTSGGVGKGVTHTSTAVATSGSGSSSSMTQSYISGSASTLLSQTSTLTTGSSSTGSAASKTSSASATALSTSLSSGDDGSITSAVPTSLAEMQAKVAAMADDWATSQPSAWQDEINELEDAIEAASSQAASVSATLKQNQRRHLMHHKKRFGGHH